MSFADLMFGIIFLFLIIIAALLILPKHMVDEPTQYSNNTSKALVISESEVQSLEQQTLDLKAQLAKISKVSIALAPIPPAMPDANRELISNDQQKIDQLTSELAAIKAEKAAIQSKFDYSELQNKQSLSEVVTINSERLSLQSQLNIAEKEETQLREQLSQTEAASSSNVTQIQTVYAAKMFSFNQYSCNVLNCSELHYEGTYTVLRTGPNSFVSLTVSVPTGMRPSSATNPM